LVGHILHDVLLLKFMLLKNHVIEGESKDHGDELKILWAFLHVAEQLLEVLSSRCQQADLVLQDLFSFASLDRFFSHNRLSAFYHIYFTFVLSPD